MSDEPRFCKDCKHFTPAMANQCSAKCGHPEFRSLVTGIAAANPEFMRSGRCGERAAMWEEKLAPEIVVTFTYPTQEYVRPEAPPQNMLRMEQLEPARWWEFWK